MNQQIHVFVDLKSLNLISKVFNCQNISYWSMKPWFFHILFNKHFQYLFFSFKNQNTHIRIDLGDKQRNLHQNQQYPFYIQSYLMLHNLLNVCSFTLFLNILKRELIISKSFLINQDYKYLQYIKKLYITIYISNTVILTI
ncbi:hypothetical protein pb186bvf_016165 [Paramecium bursaria]